ncbi:3-hydroxyacyl-CoA dehydrogenase NAD-binding domain-containing protein [Nannocystis sp. ILAH1]|uniref:3-hydroxyacyl-CoA dehydrogenase NAD-binding domain-containing protein n=1 Tax=unclassified Nannocystis TaxID=2627009 RepID=UPI00227073FF|nr:MULTISPECIES: 3-hydroxyacyl-CoA dehydrogenase NAD-binding domain-containing protein [unclassified Nannocystis]MCY0986985.1 3-hydroxyacyl-CoA dehydrogenase NAD-binding domain-containing protein [Nannocystis sp. ILAH1]MCY1071868.1 3-hydroxyacyl-CoA dehydrogenase NAD-binding domain-containing protein [Nannocystis sp. RBIL2]
MTSESNTKASAIHWKRDDDGVVILTIDDPSSSVNTMNDAYTESMAASVERLEAERESITGVIVTSAKKSFFAGGDLNRLRQYDTSRAAEQTAHIERVKDHLRRLEKFGRPVVAAINGTALGGGLEVALAAHHRLVADVPGCQIGQPEVTLGLLPGGGGITRIVRMIGLQKALTQVILPGTKFNPREAKEIGLVDELVASVDLLIPRAKAWIAANPNAAKPWDKKGFEIPGGSAASPAISSVLPAMAANLRKQLKGAPLPAPRAALAAAVEGSLVDFDTASLIETRYLVSLTTGQVAKNMIGAFFFDLQKINAGASRPTGFPKFQAKKVGVIGAGMMGAAIAYVAAKVGIEVVLKDVSLAGAQKGKNYAVKIEQKALERGKTTQEKAEALLARIHPTEDPKDFAGVDFVIEAVFESVELKHKVFREIEGFVEPTAVLGSNTSTLPIALLAEGVQRPADFIGIHFFSPVDKMQLVEIVRGKNTSDAVLAKVFDFVLQIRKTPIVVNDARGFFTSRVIGKFINEAVAAVGEGIEPATIEQAALQAGYPAGALQLLDELTITLTQKIRQETRKAEEAQGKTWVPHGAEAVVDRMIEELGRKGRSTGGGFYEYDEAGKRTGIWPGLRAAFKSGSKEIPFVDMQERMLFAEAIDTVRCVDDGVLTSAADANIGSIYGIGFPAWTGGVLQYINQYEGGLRGFVTRARELAAAYGPHFEPPASLVAKAERGERYE